MRGISDELDVRILELLQEDAALTGDELAERLPLSPSAIARRIRRLRADGTIASQVAILADAGRFLSAFVHIQLDRHSLEAVEAFRRRLTASVNVQMVMEVTGAFDMVLLIAARDMESFNALVDSLLGSDSVVRRYETSFVKKRRKFSTAVPLAQLLA